MAKIDKIICPLMQKPCIEDGVVVNGEVHACRFWIYVQGKGPQTGQPISHGDCAIAWIPMLLVENSKEQRTTHSEVEKLRNEVATTAQNTAELMVDVLNTAHRFMLEGTGKTITIVDGKKIA